jgi:hypothetical protein
VPPLENHLFRAVLSAFLGLVSLGMLPAQAQSLFDAALETLPQAQGWTYAAIGSAATFLTNSAALLDTTSSSSTLAGWSQIAPVKLNRTNGFSLHFTARVDAETHTSTNRAGFSVIVLCDDAHGLEVGFWNNRIFVQSDNPLFTHGEDVGISTTDTVDYGLSLLSTNYVLTANGAVILTGPVRDYTAYNGPFNVYSTANFLFMGDDTTSANAREEIRNVSLITAPRLSIDREGVVTWTSIINQPYELQASSDLLTWSNLATIPASTSTFSHTNAAKQSPRFYRVITPN